ncbi:hypothetical protein HPP92_011803 [Vanilla planifolia]|uniref:Uncharacterized protein n=1 Tax=Vanilla planifolia TaxID=51239 RepID=A0A835R7N3_VANPL|nr:hypothetical protein HPP92_011803 [Vanilla planifolia]
MRRSFHFRPIGRRSSDRTAGGDHGCNGERRGGRRGLGLVDVVGDGEDSGNQRRWVRDEGRGFGEESVNGEKVRKTDLGRGSFAGTRDVVSIGLHQSKGEAAKRAEDVEFGRIPLIDVANIPLMRITYDGQMQFDGIK